jgi:hypothetical protein
MSLNEERSEINAVVGKLRDQFGIPDDPTRRGPVPLARFLDECNLLHVTLPKLSRVEIAKHLRAEGIDRDLAERDETGGASLVGFLLTMGDDGYVFVTETEPTPPEEEKEQKSRVTSLGRRRFTAAHELGHFILHRSRMERWIEDTKETINEATVGEETREMERQANYFAAVLLMPEQVCRNREAAFRKAYKTCPRTPFAYVLAAELLVSAEAMRNRLEELKVGDE